MNHINSPNPQRPRVEWKNGQYAGKTVVKNPAKAPAEKPLPTARQKAQVHTRPQSQRRPQPAYKTEDIGFSDFLLGLAHKRSVIVAFILILAVSVGIAMAITSFSESGEIELPEDIQNQSDDTLPIIDETDPARTKAASMAKALNSALKAVVPELIVSDIADIEVITDDVILPPPVNNAVLGGKGYAVCIDPGHGFDDVGTSNDALGVTEKDVVLNVGIKLRDKLQAAGVTVYMTHDTNTPPEGSAKPYLFGMKKRNGLANSLSDVDLFLSIHCDAYYEDPSVTGVRVYHMNIDNGSQEVAEAVSKAYVDLGSEKAPIVKEMSGMNSYQVLRDSKMAAILVETGFVSNTEEAAAMLTEEWLDASAQALADAVINSFEQGIIG